MSNLIAHAESELALLGMGKDAPDEMNRLMHDNIIQLVKVFSKQGHSGFSANYAANMVDKLLRYDALSPLTGNDDEWMDLMGPKTEFAPDDLRWQNKRDGRVFRTQDGHTFLSEGKVFVDKDGTSWTNWKSRVEIKKFPYTPVTKRIQRRWWKFWL